jgi:hypothetical protein
MIETASTPEERRAVERSPEVVKRQLEHVEQNGQ